MSRGRVRQVRGELALLQHKYDLLQQGADESENARLRVMSLEEKMQETARSLSEAKEKLTAATSLAEGGESRGTRAGRVRHGD